MEAKQINLTHST